MLSRVASNLYWMSRYVERAENTARVLDVAWRMSLLAKEPRLQDQEWFAPLNITGTLFPFSGRHNIVCAREVLHFMALDPDRTLIDVITPIAPDPAYAELYADVRRV